MLRTRSSAATAAVARDLRHAWRSLRRTPAFQQAPADPQAVGAPSEALAKEGWLRILPSMWAEKGGLDGFFIARLDRTG